MPSHYSQVQRTIGAELLVRRLCDGLEAMPFAVKRDRPSTPAIACWTFSERFELCSRWRWAASWKRADQQLNKATSLHTVAVWLRLGGALPLLLNNGELPSQTPGPEGGTYQAKMSAFAASPGKVATMKPA